MNDQQPEYLSASPTVMAYDYANGDYFAPAYLGAQTSAQAHAAAVAAVGQTGMHIARPAPLVAHPTPQYPKVGHEPTFTMPMNKGEWNLRGLNMPTYSPALPHMPGSDWQNFPQPIDGAQLDFVRPQFSAFAGFDMGDVNYTKPGRGKFRDVQSPEGYRYRQFADGAIQVLVSLDASTLPPGTVLKGDAYTSDPAGYKRWVAITTQIGSWDDFAKGRTSRILKAVTDAAIQQIGQRKGKKRKGGRAAPAMLPGAPMAPALPAEDESKGFLSGPMPWVIGGSLAVLLLVVLTSRSNESKK